jgi:hypothetical protein
MNVINDYYVNDDLSFDFGPMKTFINDIKPEISLHNKNQHLMEQAASKGDLDTMKKLRALNYKVSYQTLYNATAQGHLNVIKWIKNNYNIKKFKKCMEIAAINGHLDIVKWIYGNSSDYCIDCVAEEAMTACRKEIVDWLQNNTIKGYFEKNLGEGHASSDEWIKCKLGLSNTENIPNKKRKLA